MQPITLAFRKQEFYCREAGLLHSKNANAGDTDAGTRDGSRESRAGVHLAAQAGVCLGDNKAIIEDSITDY